MVSISSLVYTSAAFALRFTFSSTCAVVYTSELLAFLFNSVVTSVEFAFLPNSVATSDFNAYVALSVAYVVLSSFLSSEVFTSVVFAFFATSVVKVFSAFVALVISAERLSETVLIALLVSVLSANVSLSVAYVVLLSFFPTQLLCWF